MLLEWLKLEEKISCPAIRRKQQIWPGLCTLVNGFQQSLQSFQSQYCKFDHLFIYTLMLSMY